MSWVTFDHGNSSLKWGLWSRDEDDRSLLRARGQLSHVTDPAEWRELEETLSAHPVEGALYCGVAGAEAAERVREAWARLAPRATWSEPEPSLSNDCLSPDQVGRDRLMAACGAFSVLQASVIIVDAGSALTVDALSIRDSADPPCFLGGAIAPGPAALAAALGAAGAQLFVVDPSPEDTALGRSTETSLAAGVTVGFAGAAARLVQEVSLEAGLEEAAIVITGGGRSFLSRPGLFEGRELHVYEDLVHAGLLAAAGESFRLEEEMWGSA